MKNGIAVALLFVGLISVILGIVCFSMENGAKELNSYYGGDAYTGIQQAAAQGARNGYYGNNILCLGFGSVLTVAGMVIMLLAINSILKNEFGGGGSAKAGDSASGGNSADSGSDYACSENADGTLCIKKYYGETSDLCIPEKIRGAYGAGSAAAGIPAPAESGREPSFPAPANPLSSAHASAKSVPVPTAPAPVITVSSDGNFKYTVNDDGSVRITKYVGKATAVRIPEKVSEKSVIAVNSFSFASCINITEVIIPQSVTSIGERAFRNCSSLCNVVIPKSVTSIGENAFSDCPDLTLTVIPGSCGEQYCKDNGLKYRLAD